MKGPPVGIARRLQARAARRRQKGLRPGLAVSALLHLGFAALAVLAALHRPKPPEPLPPPAYAVYYESGAPDRPAEPEQQAEAAPSEPAPPPAPEPAPPVPPLPVPVQPPLPPAAPPPLAEALPLPPPPVPPPPRERPSEPSPQAQAALTAPPRPVQPPRPAPQQRLPGLYLPEGLAMVPAPPRQATPPRPNASRPLDLSLGRTPPMGRASPEPEAEVRGAQVGPDWRNAFRRWLEEHKRYPEMARVLGQEGTTRIEIVVEPGGRVRGLRLLRQSGSVWLDAGTLSLFCGANLPPFPPGADPTGVTVDLTIHYVLIR